MTVRLYNKYGAWTSLGGDIGDRFRRMTEGIIKAHPTIDLSDLHLVISDSIDMPITMERTLRGLRIREKEENGS